jgi:hypothetical protein
MPYKPVTPEQIAEAKERVVEAAVQWRKCSTASTGLLEERAIDGLIALLSRQSAEKDLLPPEEVERREEATKHCAARASTAFRNCDGCPFGSPSLSCSIKKHELVRHYRALLALEGNG